MKLSKEKAVESFTDLVTAAFEPIRTETINMLISNASSKRSISFDKAAKLLSIGIHELGALLTQTIPEKLKNDIGFIRKLAQFTGKTIKETKHLVKTAKPPEIAFKTLRKPGHHDFAVKLEHKLKNLVDIKYGSN